MKELTIKFRDSRGRVDTFNALCKRNFIKPEDVYGRPALDGVSVVVTMRLDHAQKVCDDANCPPWLLDMIEAASFTACEVAK